MRRLSRISRSNSELPGVSIVKSECMFGEKMVSQNSRDICETESLFPVLDETPICFEIRVYIYVGVFDQHTMRHSTDTSTYIYTQHAISLQKEFGS